MSDGRRLVVELEDLERWAEQLAQHSHTDPDWRSRRAYVEAHRDAQAESYRLAIWEVEGAESAFADAAARFAHLRALLEEVSGSDRGRVAAALRGELAWAEAEQEEARASGDSGLDPEELHAKGRVTALAAIGAELRTLVAVADSEGST